MKVLLVDVDSKIPNLALMKLSAWHKARGDETLLLKHLKDEAPLVKFDKAYASCIFSKNAKRTRRIERGLQAIKGTDPHVVGIGGYGVNGAKLPNEIEHIRPDYDLYGCDFSLGFTSRGCFRNCPWCIVPKMEGGLRDHAPITEFLHPDHSKVILLDNNFQASPRWRENLRYIIDHGLKVSLNQGLDIRLVDEEFAGILAGCKYYDIDFNERRLYFSFDMPEIEPEVRRGVEILKRAGVKPRRLMFFVLCGFGDGYDFAQDWHRFKVLLELGVDPYIMKYNDRRDIRVLNHFSRWVNQRSYKYKQQKYIRGRAWQELQAAISSLEGAA